ncbi:MAG: peptidase M15 [Desulfosarcina sp.]|nr:peptidase M15 [Desulfosarcina sp.]MBC2764514.1 peptidase M15 [Desulfosarcina sp.]
MMMSKWFILQEVLPEIYFNSLYKKYGDRLWQMFDRRMIETVDNLRDIYGKMLANTWVWGGRHRYRGWRPWECLIGAKLSQHKFGRAVDLVPVDAGVNEIRRDILADAHPYQFRFITAIESDVPWLHIDCRNHDKAQFGILEIRP